jgi:hypothetical protein
MGPRPRMLTIPRAYEAFADHAECAGGERHTCRTSDVFDGQKTTTPLSETVWKAPDT